MSYDHEELHLAFNRQFKNSPVIAGLSFHHDKVIVASFPNVGEIDMTTQQEIIDFFDQYNIPVEYRGFKYFDMETYIEFLRQVDTESQRERKLAKELDEIIALYDDVSFVNKCKHPERFESCSEGIYISYVLSFFNYLNLIE